jgi:hypothetical protein
LDGCVSVIGHRSLEPRLSGLGLRPSGFRLRSSSYDGTRRPHTQGSTFWVEWVWQIRIKEIVSSSAYKSGLVITPLEKVWQGVTIQKP